MAPNRLIVKVFFVLQALLAPLPQDSFAALDATAAARGQGGVFPKLRPEVVDHACGDHSCDMVELEDGVLQGIAGQEGISLDIEVRLNTDAVGVPLASLSSCTGNNNPCKLALTFNNRPDKWLMLKDYYGTLNIPKLYLNKTNAPATVSAYKDLPRFQDSAGNCLLGAGKASACADADIQNHPALKLSSPGFTGTFENDILANLFVGRVAIETGATGYNNDTNGTFLGLQLRDTSTSAPQARVDVDGHVALFGF
ncbi:MAG: hypothetical protein ACOY9J_11965 [Pseudomonadota bacterium]